ncbi:MAG TPA: phosphoribosylformylglycinamidine cyclo-ligase [Actinomycetota bacterium]
MSEAYRRAGVDLAAAARAVDMIRDVAATATRPEVVSGIGGFAGLFDLGDDRLLAAATDGVGTKLDLARRAARLDTIGIDLVAMCANDVVCTGAEPLFFLDYVAVERLVPKEVATVVTGVAEGCRRAGCALLGGETAEHPGVMPGGHLDLAGFCVGLVPRDHLLGPERVREGDLLIGLPSTGLHANGFSLVRRAIEGLDLEAPAPWAGMPLARALLEPTAIYVEPVLAAARAGAIHAAAHITGGGLMENVPRMLPEGLGATLDRSAWAVPEVFTFLAERADIPHGDMARTFNLGLGMVLAAPGGGGALDLLAPAGAAVVGEVVPGQGVSM